MLPILREVFAQVTAERFSAFAHRLKLVSSKAVSFGNAPPEGPFSFDRLVRGGIVRFDSGLPVCIFPWKTIIETDLTTDVLGANDH